MFFLEGEQSEVFVRPSIASNPAHPGGVVLGVGAVTMKQRGRGAAECPSFLPRHEDECPAPQAGSRREKAPSQGVMLLCTGTA